MIRQRISTVITTASLLLSLTAASAALPASTLAAVANIDIGGGTVVDGHPRAATPTQVSPGNVAGFYLWVRNEDPANLSTFFMNTGSNATPVGAYFTHNGGDKTDCPIDDKGKLGCNFGAFNSGDVLEIVAGFKIPLTAPDTDPYCKPPAADAAPPDPTAGYRTGAAIAPVCVDFSFGSNSGYVLPKKSGNNSRGDAYHWYDFVTTNVGIDAGAGFPFCNLALFPTTVGCTTGFLSVFNAGHASRTDLQTTKVTAPASAFNSAHGSTGLAVRDNNPTFNCASAPGVPTCANHEGNGASAFVGQWSQVDVNTEQLFTGELIRIDLEMYGVNPNSIDGVVHLWYDGTTWHEDPIVAKCPNGTGPQTSQCFWVSGSGQTTLVSIWTTNNGNFRTF
jgi:hypothetical protein